MRKKTVKERNGSKAQKIAIDEWNTRSCGQK
jgi:hypothetical protein